MPPTEPAVVTPLPSRPPVRFRTAEAADLPPVAAMLRRCSAESRYRRFFAGTGELPDRVLHFLVAPRAGVALVATEPGGDVVGIGHLVAGSGAPDAVPELALLVEDGWQRRGIGTALADRLLGIGAAAGHRRVKAVLLPQNPVPARMIRRLGPAGSALVDGLLELELRLPVPPAVRAG